LIGVAHELQGAINASNALEVSLPVKCMYLDGVAQFKVQAIEPWTGISSEEEKSARPDCRRIIVRITRDRGLF
jgi:hypothetical protein